MTPNAYDRDLLRTQIDILRRAAALRSRLENEISIEHEAATSHASTHAEQLLAVIKTKYKSDTSVTQKEYEAVVQQLNAAATADQQKLELQRTIRLAEIVRQHESKHKKLEEDYQFEEGSYKEVYKDKRKLNNFLRLKKNSLKRPARLTSAIPNAGSISLNAAFQFNTPPTRNRPALMRTTMNRSRPYLSSRIFSSWERLYV